MNAIKPLSKNGNGLTPFQTFGTSTTQNTTIRSRLVRIQEWEALAVEAGYDPATMAALCPISLRQLERFFKTRFGKSPRAWVMELRCRRARELIQRGYSNKAIVLELNFADESHICHAFKKMYGRPPQTFAPLYGRSVAQNQECRSETNLHG